MVPYTTKTGLQIGIRYQPPPAKMYPDEERMQSLLLSGVRKRINPWPAIVGILMFITAIGLII